MGLFIGKSLNVSVSSGFSGFSSVGGGNCAKPKPPADDCNDKCKPKPKPDCDSGGGAIKFGVSVMPLGAVLFGGLAGKLF
ncbi:hypothetical protein C4J98_1224 [Pseudomonas orientalis]|uniref:hypothetical protein n=1 Tax=Pseudomonas orientalis TaxID=76758 RepID=UPI000F5643B7|nr:hypothetical protein [Pseudomonas orientalis]AZE82653.1 hypothetical protein C4J98_1224 [Pseudomonas orientalis]